MPWPLGLKDPEWCRWDQSGAPAYSVNRLSECIGATDTYIILRVAKAKNKKPHKAGFGHFIAGPKLKTHPDCQASFELEAVMPGL